MSVLLGAEGAHSRIPELMSAPMATTGRLSGPWLCFGRRGGKDI